MRTKRIEVHESGGNIFADLGLPDADNHFLKAQIVAELYRLTNARKLTQDKAGALMEISQPEVSRLFKGNFREYSIERLMAFLTAFDRDVDRFSPPVETHQEVGARTDHLQTSGSVEPALHFFLICLWFGAPPVSPCVWRSSRRSPKPLILHKLHYGAQVGKKRCFETLNYTSGSCCFSSRAISRWTGRFTEAVEFRRT